ncbi:rhodanese-like domain-containing protein [Rhodobacteraceae bacterium HSP-20]|uniref:Rhodanese-like domain-containing protein n=1 Tax=Paragemmobacter amnigenus TaxID=2852097 RepID=A0ABS6IYX7_9RHOB|nr:rhodanese-like domain-containing protein [Rhodobacter amnigenus]MBU9696710.1 rhodanese-like domain-containing protein [Rhodobacter amnigenus]MBV4387937.1 rhodanese-like domain-containing protein [Rhodobacter amnigenus]
MPATVKDMLAAANAAVEKVDHATAQDLIAQGALLLDVRDAPELETSGKIPGALHVSRGMLEFRADPASPYHNPAFDPARPILVYCASGGRSALSGKTLKDMGYPRVYNIGGFKDWVEAGGPVDHPVDSGM